MSRSTMRLALALALALALVPSVAGATPPDFLTSRADVLCTGADRVALLVHSVGNAGSHYITENRWHLVMVDAAGGELQWHDHGALTVNTVEMVEQGDEPLVSYRPGEAPSLVRTLGEWGMVSCGTLDASFAPGGEPARFGIEVSEAGVFLTLGDHRRGLEIAGTWDPAELAMDQFPWASDTPHVPQSQEPISYLGDSEGLSLVRTLPLETRTAFIVARHSEFGDTQVVVATRRAVASRAMAWLVNARALDEHRAGHADRSSHGFAAALDLDPSFDTARYNLACALARQGDVAGAVRHLEALPATADLRPKIEADADFDPVRADPAFTALLDALP